MILPDPTRLHIIDQDMARANEWLDWAIRHWQGQEDRFSEVDPARLIGWWANHKDLQADVFEMGTEGVMYLLAIAIDRLAKYGRLADVV